MLRGLARKRLTEDAEERIDRAIAGGYRRLPAERPDALVEALAVASIEAEPWCTGR